MKTTDQKVDKLEQCLTMFMDEMFTELVERVEQGYTGWNKRKKISDHELLLRLLKNAQEGHFIDVANLAMFLWWRNRKD